ncbi:hypothetical protein PC116_g1933 [Phytophthora cactorum]|nr:hypothetical protein PC116_g1933 [Phytophthora cactorum]
MQIRQLCFLNIYPQKKTLNVRGAKTVWVRCGGASKERATVMLLGDSNGVRYTPLADIHKRERLVERRAISAVLTF